MLNLYETVEKLEAFEKDFSKVIRPTKGWRGLDWTEIWNYRELLLFLTWRDIQVRYKQTILGVAWAILQPVMTMVIFSFFFGRLAKMPSDGIPYPIFSYSALIPWIFFSNGVIESSQSLVASSNLVKKVYFPRIVIPVAAVLSGSVDFFLSFLVLLGMMFWYGIVPKWECLVLLPAFVALEFITALGVGLWFTAMNVKFRDVRYAVPFIIQIWLFSTPIVYPSSLLHGIWKTLYGLNPMAGVVEGFRWVLLGVGTSPGPMVLVSVFVAFIILFTGVLYFTRLERHFADVV